MLEVHDRTPGPCLVCGDTYNSPARAEWNHTNPNCPKYKRWQIKNGGVPPEEKSEEKPDV